MQRLTTTDRLLGSPPSTTAVMFNAVSGVPVRADIAHPYNTYGTAVRHVGPVLPRFMDAVEDWLGELQRMAARKLEALVLCSVWRKAKPGERFNRHAEGQAMDIGGIWWDRRDGVTAWDYGKRRKEAIGVEATLRLRFVTVLGPTSNRDHDNHWHVNTVSDGDEPAITGAELEQSRRGVRKVEVVYIQDACSTVHGIPLKLDGVWGPKTAGAFEVVVSSLDLDGDSDITDPMVYRAFNVATALVGFGHIEKVG